MIKVWAGAVLVQIESGHGVRLGGTAEQNGCGKDSFFDSGQSLDIVSLEWGGNLTRRTTRQRRGDGQIYDSISPSGIKPPGI